MCQRMQPLNSSLPPTRIQAFKDFRKDDSISLGPPCCPSPALDRAAILVHILSRVILHEGQHRRILLFYHISYRVESCLKSSPVWSATRAKVAPFNLDIWQPCQKANSCRAHVLSHLDAPEPGLKLRRRLAGKVQRTHGSISRIHVEEREREPCQLWERVPCKRFG